MRTIKIIAAVALLLVVSAVSFVAGRNSMVDVDDKNYQAACMLSDICHIALDNCDEFDEIYYDYIDNLDCDPKAVITREEIQDYYWCY